MTRAVGTWPLSCSPTMVEHYPLVEREPVDPQGVHVEVWTFLSGLAGAFPGHGGAACLVDVGAVLGPSICADLEGRAGLSRLRLVRGVAGSVRSRDVPTDRPPEARTADRPW